MTNIFEKMFYYFWEWHSGTTADFQAPILIVKRLEKSNGILITRMTYVLN